MTRLIALVSLMSVLGCAHPQTKKDEPLADNGKRTATAARPAAATEVAKPTDPNEQCGVVRVHFPLDSSEMDASDKDGLSRSAGCLKADRSLHVIIEGNADERGTEEYNLALGDKRATAVSRYLQALGASGTQLKTVSYGKENPLCVEHDEACWSKNRRAAVKPTGGAHKE